MQDIVAFPTTVLTPELINWAHVFVWESGISSEHAPIRNFLKTWRVPQVYETDDNYLNINKYNSASYVIDPNDVRDWLTCTDVNTVTRKSLGEYYKMAVPDLQYCVLPNCIDFETFPVPKEYVPSKDIVRIGWFGGSSHYEDIASIMPALRKLVKTYGDKLQLVVFGWDGELNPMFGNRNVFSGLKLEYIPWVPIGDYYNAVSQLNLDISIIPLVSNIFNNVGKSPLKFLESASCRYPCVISNNPVYDIATHRETAYMVDSAEGWEDALVEMIDNPDLRKYISDKAYTFVRENYDIEKNISKWADLYRTMASQYKG